MYCKLENEQITLYVKKEEGLQKCETYIQSLEQLTKEKYDEILLILYYINQGEDIVYWQEILEITKKDFFKFLRYKTMIIEMIQTFEAKFLIKYQSALAQELTPYLEILQSHYLPLTQAISPESEKIAIVSQQVQQQIITITTILQASSLDEIMQLIPAYLYLKQELI
ncbi:MAG: sugar transferase [Candidatus Peribacteria bacterium]|nr:sugar transferase [Candidatus Peribacteria bacterium]